jgi:ribonuclease P protein component
MPKHSLRNKKDFDQVFKAGQSFYCPILGIKALKNDLKLNRLGIIISLKISKSAVVRNKIKRQIRVIFKKNIEESAKSYDFVIIVLDKIINKEYKEIEENLIKAHKKLILK